MQHFMVQAGYNGCEVNAMDADGLASQHQSISSNNTDLMYFQLTIKAPYSFMYPTCTGENLDAVTAVTD